ncbi:MAG: hypothetical protein DME88_12125 [Verrucomicrobia bacterium]|nr:MAG: hypothetical protein DME88_12125 [Verrucomicrobiota bacterium]
MKFGGLAHEGSPETNSNPGSASGRRRGMPNPGTGIRGNSLRRPPPLRYRSWRCWGRIVGERLAITARVPAFAVHTELHGPETVDLTPFMREDILLNLPAHPHCDRDGDRVCKGKQIETANQDTKRKSDWSALDKLKLNR